VSKLKKGDVVQFKTMNTHGASLKDEYLEYGIAIVDIVDIDEDVGMYGDCIHRFWMNVSDVTKIGVL